MGIENALFSQLALKVSIGLFEIMILFSKLSKLVILFDATIIIVVFVCKFEFNARSGEARGEISELKFGWRRRARDD